MAKVKEGEEGRPVKDARRVWPSEGVRWTSVGVSESVDRGVRAAQRAAKFFLACGAQPVSKASWNQPARF